MSQYKTGLRLPSKYPTGFNEYPSEDIWTYAQLEAAFVDPARKPSVEIWPWVLDQGAFNSCNPCAATGGYAKAREYNGHPHVDFAPEYMYAHISGGRDQGSLLEDSLMALVKIGVCERALVQHGTYTMRGITAQAKENAKRYRALAPYRIPGDDLDRCWRTLLTAVAKREPVIVAVHVGRTFENLNSGGFCGIDRGPGNHAVHADDGKRLKNTPCDASGFCLDMPNSWGKRWGRNGRGYITRGHIAETRQYHAFYAVRGTITDPVAPGPFVR